MSIIRRLLRIDPQRDFSKGRRAFDHGNYTLASKLFQKTFKQFDTLEMKIISLENAAISAEYAEMYEKSSELYYHCVCLKLGVGHSSKEVIPDIEKSLKMARLSEKSPINPNKLVFMKFLILLSEKNFNQLTSFYKNQTADFSDKYNQALEKTWLLIHSSETFEKKEHLPHVDLPEEFVSVLNSAEKVMQRCSLCEAVLESQSKHIEKGMEFAVLVTLTAHTSMSIHKISLKTGSRGRILTSSTPELPLKLSTGENYSISFSIIPNLPGEWLLGPVSILYSIPSETGEYPVESEPISLTVKEGVPGLKVSIFSETIEEDLEYLITILAENVGKTMLQDVKIITEIPEGVKIQEGTNEKFISTLGEGESFQYEIRLRFSLDQTHFSGHIIRASGFIQNDQQLAKCSIRLGGG